MASPQTDNGYIRISTELWEALIRIRISGEARQLLDFIIRKTYGYQKKEDIISISQFHSATKINKPSIIRGIHKLIEMNIIIKKDNGVIPTYCFQKDYDKWKPLSKKITFTKKIIGVYKKDNKSYQKSYPQKIKDNNTIDKGVLFSKEHPDAVKVVKYFIETLDDDSNCRPTTPTEKIKWVKTAQWAISRMGEYGDEKVIDIINSFRDGLEDNNGFEWRSNFQSIMKLRKKNKEDIYYLDYFWEKIKEKCHYGKERHQRR